MTGRSVRILLLCSLIAALLASVATYGLDHRLKTETGLRSTFYSKVEASEPTTSSEIDLDFLRSAPPPAPFSVQWEGFWRVPESSVYQFSVSADDFAALWIDNRLIAEARVNLPQPVFVLHPFRAGIHDIKAVFKQYAGAYDFQLLCARAGSKLKPMDPEMLFAKKPEESDIKMNRMLTWLKRLSRLLWSSAALVLFLAIFPRIVTFYESRVSRLFTPKIVKAFWMALPCLILLYGAALRFDAVISRFQPIDGSERFVERQLQIASAIGRLRPEPHWDKETRPYIKGDPGGYLRFAREMKHFYAGHVREPLFVFTTKTFLWLLNQQDIAVSFASAFFSALTILATYLLGSVFSRWAGALASFGVAIEREVIRSGTAGMRDDAFMFFTVLFAYACVRVYRKPSLVHVIFAGFVGGGACLVRVTALSFVLPTYIYLLFVSRPWRERMAPIAASAVLAAAVLAPYVINCAITYGDPLYAINDMTKFYRTREHYDAAESMSVREYLGMKMANRPYQFLNTAVSGFTSYPLNNKWSGFDYWSPLIGRFLYWAAILGLFLFLFSAEGRLMLVVMLASILPFAFTWDVKGGAEYRFTIHVYPFFLVAACFVLIQALSLLKPSRLAQFSSYIGAHGRSVALQIAAVFAVVMLGWLGYRMLQIKQFEEALTSGESVAVPAENDSFFGKGWSAVVQVRDERLRVSDGPDSLLRLPLVAGKDHNLSITVNPLIYESSPSMQLHAFLNNTAIGTIQLENKGAAVYRVPLPKEIAHSGLNDIRFQSPEPFALSSAAVSLVP